MIAGLLALTGALAAPARANTGATVFSGTLAPANPTGRTMVRASNGDLYLAYLRNYGGVPRVFVARSTDKGATWVETTALPVDATGCTNGFGEPTLAIDSTDKLWLAFVSNVPGPCTQGRMGAMSGTANGTTWSGFNVMTGAYPYNGYEGIGTIAVASDNSVHLVWYGQDGGPPPGYSYAYVVRYTKYNGASWSAYSLLPGGDGTVNKGLIRPTLAIDANDVLHVVSEQCGPPYCASTVNPPSLLVYSAKPASGGAWSGPMTVIDLTAGGYDQRWPSLAVGSGGNTLQLAWSGQDAAHLDFQIKQASMSTGGTGWSAYTNIQPIAGAPQNNPSIAVDPSNNLYVVWHGSDSVNPVQNVKQSVYSGASWSAWTNVSNGVADQQYAELRWAGWRDNGWNLDVSWMDFGGGTIRALDFPPSVAGCGDGFNVKKDGSRDFTTIQTAVNALAVSLSTPTCVIVHDTMTYTEQVTVQNFTNNGYRLKIMADPGPARPAIKAPPGGGAGFLIAAASVTLSNVIVVPGGGRSYGIQISSPNVVISSVGVQDDAGNLSAAGIQISSYGVVVFSSITVTNAHGLHVTGSSNLIIQSTITSNYGSGVALYLNGASSNTITGSFISNPPGYGAYLGNYNSNWNTISFSTIISNGGPAALYLFGASSNTITRSFISNPGGTGLVVGNSSNFNSITQSTITSNWTFSALQLSGSSVNVISQNFISNPGGDGASLNNSNYNTISLSTIAAGNVATYRGLYLSGSSSNTITQSYISNPTGDAAYIYLGSNNNTISQSTMTSNAAGLAAAHFYQSSSNSISQSYLSNPAGYGAWIESGASSETISQSTVFSNAGVPAVLMGGGYSTVTQSFITNNSNTAVSVKGNFNTVSLSTITGATQALYVNSSTNTLSQDFIFNPGSFALVLDTAAFGTQVLQTRIVGGGAAAAQLTGAFNSAFSQCSITGTGGGGGSGVFINQAKNTSIDNSSVSGSQAGVQITGSTSTVISSSALTATGAGGNGLTLAGGSVGLSMTSNTVSGAGSTALGSGIFVGAGNGGQIIITSNTLTPSSQWGIQFQGAQSGGVTIWVTSNTILPATNNGGAFDTGGVWLNGLANGATIQHNSIYWRAPLGMGANTTFGILDANSAANFLHHNRISNGGAVTNGKFVAISVNNTPTEVKYNDLYSSGGGLSVSNLLQVVNTPGVVKARNNVFYNNVPPGPSAATVTVDPASAGSFSSDFNDFYAAAGSNVGSFSGTSYALPGAWSAATGRDVNSISVDPLWKSVAPGAEDLHPKSRAGRFDPAVPGFVTTDVQTAQTIDSGDLDPFAAEPAPNGVAVNQGSYGGTPEASKTFDRLQVLLPGEIPAPYTPAGKTGLASIAVGQTFTAQVRRTDQTGVTRTVADVVSLSTTSAIASNFNPANSALASGIVSFPGLKFTASAPAMSLVANDVTVPTVNSDTSTVFQVYGVTSASPTVAVSIPLNSVMASLNGGISGTAADTIAVFSVKVAIQQKVAPNFFYYDWTQPVSPAAFSSPPPVYATATLTAQNGTVTGWTMTLPNSVLTNTTQYYVRAVAFNSSGNQTVAETTFTFNSQNLNGGSPGDGQGSASVTTFDTSFNPLSSGCQLAIATVAFTAGAAGITPGGLIAVRVPDGWTKPLGKSAVNPPVAPGYGYVASTTGFTLDLNPPQVGSAVLGDNWIVYKATQAVSPGQTVYFTYLGFPSGVPRAYDGQIAGPRTFGAQVFAVMTQGGAVGNLKPIASAPGVTLSAGSASYLAFWPPEPLTLAPLQVSPTMYVIATDKCGALTTSGAGSVTVAFSAAAGAAVDNTASFMNAATGSPLAGQQTTVVVGAGTGISPAFTVMTATSGLSFETLTASATPAGPFAAPASRFVSLISSISLTGLSVDNGDPAQGALSAALPPDSFKNPVFINFSMSNPNAHWEVIISSSVSFSPEAVHRYGAGNPGRSLTWNGVNERVTPNQSVSTGTYFVKLVIEGGIKTDQSLSITNPKSASILGTVYAAGAGAVVQAAGPGANFANSAAADPSGSFQIFGLTDGASYNITASTALYFNGQFVRVTSSSNSVKALYAGADAGAMPFSQPALLRISATLPFPSPKEVFGSINVHNADYSRTFNGTLHFSSGSSGSDSGAQAFGQQASGQSIIGVPADTYSVGLNVPQLGISTTILNVAALSGTNVDLAVALPKKANVYGYAVLPTTTPFGAPVSVQASLAGSTVTVFGGTFIQRPSPGVLPTSATYGLFGLDPGVWTITARSEGFLSASNTLVIAGTADVGNPFTGGNDLFLQRGGLISGSVNLTGDSTGLSDGQPGAPGFNLFVNAYNPVTFTHGHALVRVLTDPTLASSTYSLSGLEDGNYYVTVHQDGFSDAQQTVPVSGGSGTANLTLAANNARALLTVKLSGNAGPAQFAKVALMTAGPGAVPTAKQDMTAGSPMDFAAGGGTASWHSPALGPGYYRFDALYSPTGQFQSVIVPLVNGATSAATVDLSGPGYAVSGTALFAGNVSFTSAAYSVTVSSVAGLLAAVPTTSYCLLGQASPVSPSAFHMELIPVDARTGNSLNGPLYASTGPAADCSRVSLPNLGPGDPDPMLGFVADISPAGAFNFPAVPPGTYILRNSAELDNNSSDGPELPQVRQSVTVSTSAVSVGIFKIDAGRSITGSLKAPPQTNLTGNFALTLLDNQGQAVRSVQVGFNGAQTAPYVFDKLTDGNYAVDVRDLSFPPVYTAKPLTLKVSGASLTGQDISVVQAGIVKGKIAVQQLLPDGTTGPFLLVSQANSAIMPRGFQILARANPWFQGGVRYARGSNCGPDGCQSVDFDNNDQFVIMRLLPGVYDLNFQSRNNAADTAAGGINMVSTILPGVTVSEGVATDVGTVNLVSALELRGRIYEAASSSAAANVRLEARPSNRQQATQDTLTAQTDVNGNYVLSGLNPKIRYYDIFAASRGGSEPPGTVLPPYEQKIIASVDLSSVSVLNIPLDWARHAITGKVKTPAGGPQMLLPSGRSAGRAQGSLIFIQKAGVIPVKNPLGDIQAVTDSDGNFNITTLSTGDYKLTFTALNYGSKVLGVTVGNSTSAVNAGTVTLPLGATLSGSLRKSDGSSPSVTDIKDVIAVTPDLQNFLFASLDRDVNTKTYTGYTVSGFKAGVSTAPISYKLLIVGPRDLLAPSEAQNIVFTSTNPMTLDVVYRQPKPSVLAKARRTGNDFSIQFETSQALRNKTDADNNLAAIVTTVTALGTLSRYSISSDRTKVSAVYTPAVGESSFTLALSGRSVVADPDSIDPANPEFPLYAAATFYIGIDGLANNSIANLQGGNAVIEGDTGRLTIPQGAFAVDAASAPTVTLQISSDTLAKVRTSGFRTAEEANISSLRYAPAAYPAHMLRAMAATPPQLNPLSAFYDVLLPLGVRTALAKPVPLTIAYSSTTDPSTLNLYWYNAAANAYILQQDVTGSAPVIDTVNHTVTINVNHFSTFVLFNTGVNVITGDAFGGGDITVYNMPNPFDLSVKTINTIHPVAAHTVRGTLINISMPATAASGQATLRIFTVIGERIRTIDLGFLNAGTVYYQAWDGRNDSGHDVADGVYIGQLKIGNTSKFFKMAVIK